MKKILLHTSDKTIWLKVPKKRGLGYLKSAFGYHATNEASRLFEDMVGSIFSIKEICDIDGYCYITFMKSLWGNEAQERQNVVCKALLDIFPYVEGIEVVSLDLLLTIK